MHPELDHISLPPFYHAGPSHCYSLPPNMSLCSSSSPPNMSLCSSLATPIIYYSCNPQSHQCKYALPHIPSIQNSPIVSSLIQIYLSLCVFAPIPVCDSVHCLCICVSFLCVCLCVCVCLCLSMTVHMYLCVSVSILCICLWVCVFAWLCMYVCVSMCISVCVSASVYTYIYVCVCLYVCMHVYLCIKLPIWPCVLCPLLSTRSFLAYALLSLSVTAAVRQPHGRLDVPQTFQQPVASVFTVLFATSFMCFTSQGGLPWPYLKFKCPFPTPYLHSQLYCLCNLGFTFSCYVCLVCLLPTVQWAHRFLCVSLTTVSAVPRISST